MSENESAADAAAKQQGGPSSAPTPEEALAWLKKQWASRPDRDDDWWERILAIYAAEPPGPAYHLHHDRA